MKIYYLATHTHRRPHQVVFYRDQHPLLAPLSDNLVPQGFMSTLLKWVYLHIRAWHLGYSWAEIRHMTPEQELAREQLDHNNYVSAYFNHALFIKLRQAQCPAQLASLLSLEAQHQFPAALSLVSSELTQKLQTLLAKPEISALLGTSHGLLEKALKETSHPQRFACSSPSAVYKAPIETQQFVQDYQQPMVFSPTGAQLSQTSPRLRPSLKSPHSERKYRCQNAKQLRFV